MVSVERIQNYSRLEQEASEHTSVVPPSGWPIKADIHFKDVQLSYRGSNQPALTDFNLTISNNEKVNRETIF